ncbi:GNAT family N-acetyltransferase [Actinocatenispora sera]|uniref:N-acetyltransferase domain-containing protein n=1 Tax=Actinocatenispora sera TaxID=390989 RepID=A0A810LDR5_9ACTN|nr:GNAT family N-acetyltransferase [Actinocatenispora sera]BCJ32366.1 hypothetical protein Asera_64740 [Actinocatenispora sera]
MDGLPREELDTVRLRLRAPAPGDVDDLVAAGRAAGATGSGGVVGGRAGMADAARARAFVDVEAPARWATGGAVFVVADRDTDRLLGCVELDRYVAPLAQAEAGYWLAPWALGKGFGAEAVAALTDWALHHGLARLELRAAPADAQRQRVALAAGYRREGILRGAGAGAGPDGPRHDLVLWARLTGDPDGPTPRLLPDLPGGELSDGVVALHPLDPSDADDAYAVLRLPEVYESSVPPVAPTRTQVRESCETAQSQWLAGAAARLTVRDAPSDRYAGEIVLHYTEPVTASAMLGYHLAPAWRGRGFATRAVRLLAGWAFDHVRLARLYAGADVRNTASQAVLERAGFRRVGRELSRRPGAGGGRVDDVLYELVAAPT